MFLGFSRALGLHGVVGVYAFRFSMSEDLM